MGKPKKLDDDAQRAQEAAALESMVHDRMVSRTKPWTPITRLNAYQMGWRETSIHDPADVARQVQKQFADWGMVTAYCECDVDGFAVRLTIPRAEFPLYLHARQSLAALDALPEGKRKQHVAGRM